MAEGSLALQRLSRQRDQVLVVLDLLEGQSDQGVVKPRDIATFFDRLRVPKPSNIARELKSLVASGLAVRLADASYAPSPEGKVAVADLGIQLQDIGAFEASPPVFGDVQFWTVPPEFAPQGLEAAIDRFLESNPFDFNVFGISRFPQSSDDELAVSLEAGRRACSEFGLSLHLASDKSVNDELWPNVAGSMWASRYGIALIESRNGSINPNVLIEVGAMLMTGRRCVLLKDTSVSKMPTDLVGHIYKTVDLDSSESMRGAVMDWCVNDLGLSVRTAA